ncbi:MAG: hydantoinase/oxoprolinase family protein, partial [Chloroflexota bacterium]
EAEQRIRGRFSSLTAEGRAFFSERGEAADAVAIEQFADMRYLGQEHTVRVPFPADAALTDVVETFHNMHERAYTFRLDGPTEIVNFHVVASVPSPKPRLASGHRAGDGAAKGTRSVDFDAHGRLTATIYERTALQVGVPIEGPAIVEEPASTTVNYPGQRATIDEIGNLVIDTGAARNRG